MNSSEHVHSADSKVLIATQERALAIDTLSNLLWRRVIKVLQESPSSLPLPHEAVSGITLQGDIVLAQRVVDETRKKAAGCDYTDPRAYGILDTLMQRAQSGDVTARNKPPDIAGKIAERVIQEKGSFRRYDIDLSAADVETIRESLKDYPVKLALFDEQTLHRTELLEQLELDPKFSATGILNAEAFAKKVDMDHEGGGVFVFCDIADFKKMNDERYGYAFVDNVVLATVCRALSDRWSGKKGIVARFGGDEFMIYMPDQIDQVDAAKEVADTIRKAMDSIGKETLHASLNQIPDSIAGSGGIDERVDDIAADLRSLHVKIGVTPRDRGETAAMLRHAAESELKEAAKHKERLRFPTKISNHDAVFPARGESY